MRLDEIKQNIYEAIESSLHSKAYHNNRKTFAPNSLGMKQITANKRNLTCVYYVVLIAYLLKVSYAPGTTASKFLI